MLLSKINDYQNTQIRVITRDVRCYCCCFSIFFVIFFSPYLPNFVQWFCFLFFLTSFSIVFLWINVNFYFLCHTYCNTIVFTNYYNVMKCNSCKLYSKGKTIVQQLTVLFIVKKILGLTKST